MSRYDNIPTIKTSDNIRYIKTVIYPDIPVRPTDFYVTTTVGDRYETLSQEYYGNTDDYWIIARANTQNRDSLFINPGVQLRIPTEIESIKREYSRLNS